MKSDWRPPELGSLPSWKGARRVGLDIETCDPKLKTLGPGVRRGGYIIGVSFAIEGDRDESGQQKSYYLPIRHFGGDNMPIEQVMFYLRSQAKAYRGEIVGANFQYDLDYLEQERVVFPNVHRVRDIQIADPILYELHQSYSLQAVAKRWGYEGKSEHLLREAAREFRIDPKNEMWKLPARFVGEYAGDDARLALEIIQRQEDELRRQDLWDVYELESRLQPVLLQMRRWGVRVDTDRLDQFEKLMLEAERSDCAELSRRTGVKVEIGDVNKKKVLAALLREIGVRFKQTATGQPQIDQALLKRIDHPVAELIMHAKKCNKNRTTFVKSVRDNMTNGRIHATFNQLRTSREQDGDEKGAKYGRMSCSNPNLQQQPARDKEFAKAWRSIYIPDEGCEWMSADYSQQEPRMLVHFAEIVGLRGASEAAERYRTDPRTDNHSMMTRMIYPELAHLDDQDPEFQQKRKFCKNIFLGLCYGMGGGKLATQLGLPTETKRKADGTTYLVAGPQAQALLDKFDANVPFVRRLAKKCEERAAQRGYILTLLGRRCRFPLQADGTFDWTFKALNRLIQGSSGDQTKMAMVAIAEAGLPIQLQIHDELCTSISSRDQADAIAHVMQTCAELRVPSVVDVEIGPSWGEAA